MGPEDNGAAGKLGASHELVNPELFVYVVLKMNYLTLKYGRCDASAFAFACYPIVAYGLGLNLPKVRRLQDIALELAETGQP